ncbi:SRPBCC family protein [Paenibacillus rigui]|nr:SRPBCC domain-containing protein [Paenibacillus rigui]
METKVTGQTQSAGFQIGVRRTLPITREQAWAYVTSADGIRQWLGEGAELHFEPKYRYRTGSGAEGEVRVVKPQQQLRLTWQKPGWAKPSTIQIRLIENGSGKTTVSFHQENLADATAREAMKQHWEEVLQHMLNHTNNGV